MGFFDDIGKNIGAILSPMSLVNPTDLVSQGVNLGAGVALGNTDLGQTLGIKNGFQGAYAPIANPVTQDQITTAMGQVTGLQPEQADLAKILKDQALGMGINPAQNMLNQATSQNVANQAALQAGQRGVGGNAGLIARQVGQQGANIQQQAAGQAATMGAQQQLSAMGQLQNQQSLQQQGALNNQGQLLGAQGNFNQSQVSNYGNVNQVNQATQEGNSKRNAGLIGGLLGGLGSAIGMADGGQVPEEYAQLHSMYYGGGKVPAMVSPGEKYVPPQEAKQVAQGDKSLAQAGEKIKGKAQVKGDSPKNDTVRKDLDAGGVVIPRSVMESEDPVKNGTKFLIEAMNKSKGHDKDFKEALKKAAAGRKK